MGLIPKIVLTPIKWVSRQVLHRTLLCFPGRDPQSPIACTYCPEMCRFACPVAVASGDDTLTPSNKNSLLYKEMRWPKGVAAGGPLWPIFACTGCGRCTKFCLHGIQVGSQLFEGRIKYSWEAAQKLAAQLTDDADPVGDLADELGDIAQSERRLARYLSSKSAQQCFEVAEPRSLFYLKKKGINAVLSWDGVLAAVPSSRLAQAMEGRRWLIHESVWLSRRLERAVEVKDWVLRAQQVAQLVLPFSHGEDCQDCGGEGMYARTFPQNAQKMAQDLWERDRHRADGILCFSERSASHFRRSLGNGVPVISLGEEYAS